MLRWFMVGGWRHRSQLNTLVWMLFKVLWAVSYLKGLSVIAFIAPGLFAHSCPGTHTHTHGGTFIKFC